MSEIEYFSLCEVWVGPGRDTARRYTNGPQRDVTKQAVTVMGREIAAASPEQQVDGSLFSYGLLE